MSRKTRKVKKRDILPDARTGQILVTKFINCMMFDGKKSVAQKIFYDALDKVAEKNQDSPPGDIFRDALENVKPFVEVKSRRVGGANYQIPIEVAPERREALAIRWLRDAARSRGEKTMAERLGNEILDAFNRTGSAIKKREDTHRMAEANKAFAHYRW